MAAKSHSNLTTGWIFLGKELQQGKQNVTSTLIHMYCTVVAISTFYLKITGQSFSEVLFASSTNPQFDNRLSIELTPVNRPSFNYITWHSWTEGRLQGSITSSVHENSKLRTTFVRKMFYPLSPNVLSMFCAWNFHVLNW